MKLSNGNALSVQNCSVNKMNLKKIIQFLKFILIFLSIYWRFIIYVFVQINHTGIN